MSKKNTKIKEVQTSIVKILGQNWTIELTDDLPENKSGECDYENCTLRINSLECEESLGEIALHEILHAIFYISGLRSILWNLPLVGPGIEEFIISTISPILYGYMRDNKINYER